MPPGQYLTALLPPPCLGLQLCGAAPPSLTGGKLLSSISSVWKNPRSGLCYQRFPQARCSSGSPHCMFWFLARSGLKLICQHSSLSSLEFITSAMPFPASRADSRIKLPIVPLQPKPFAWQQQLRAAGTGAALGKWLRKAGQCTAPDTCSGYGMALPSITLCPQSWVGLGRSSYVFIFKC